MEMKICVVVCLNLVFLVGNATKIHNPRILNGDVAKEGQFPWQVGVTTIDFTTPSMKSCGGALISDQWVLTAAHCIYDDADATIIYYGTLNQRDPNANSSDSFKSVVHDDYDHETLKNDIGLVYLDSPVEFNDKVQPVSLGDKDVEAGTNATVTGWGFSGDSGEDYFDVLRYITVNTIDNDECIESYGYDVINPGVICTGVSDPVKNPCLDDGGDPLVVNIDGKSVHVGLFSFLSSLGCESSIFPAGYTRTAYYRDWIKKVTGV